MEPIELEEFVGCDWSGDLVVLRRGDELQFWRFGAGRDPALIRRASMTSTGRLRPPAGTPRSPAWTEVELGHWVHACLHQHLDPRWAFDLRGLQVAVSTDGQRVACTGGALAPRLFELDVHGEVLRSVPLHWRYPVLSYRPDSREIWIAEGARVLQIDAGIRPPRHFAVPGLWQGWLGRDLYLLGEGTKLMVADANTQTVLQQIDVGGRIHALDFDRRRRRLGVSAGDRITLFRIEAR